ncbi:uncharacterized protein E0L32_010342 [Thyridium curvatum]|uniref:Transcription factor domain-containing protein n=1 Tax=Thyridium curvatum TaxID=1093900 RepID=A0A507ASX8_9PEZI|nr:uncharacterized protein E0L32_010342 [Thyridium curvatum]TPX08011.1 hypothetical protein E0L32_010342 [Thyridium curvatum]
MQFLTLNRFAVFSPCQTCRARKKRCYHIEDAQNGAKANGSERPEKARRLATIQVAETHTRESSPVPGRVSAYNPESVLEDLAKPRDPAESQQDCPTHLGSQESPLTDHHCHATVQRSQRKLNWYRRYKRRHVPKLTESHRRYLEEAGAFLELPRATTDALLPIYNSLLDDLIALVDGPTAFRDYSNGQASPYLVRAICLVTCKTKHAAPFLRLSEDGPVLEPLKFASRILSGLDAAMKAELEPDRVTRIRVLALMSLSNNGNSGVDRAYSYLSQAISEGWTMSIHWNIPGNPDQEQCDLLWWTLRNFDRLNKPIMGAAPFMIDDADIGIDRTTPKPGHYKTEIMAISLVLGDLMAQATRVYKATSVAREDNSDDFPTLADVTYGTTFHSFHKSHRAYLELWYHIAAMLSCKYSGPGSIPYNRRLASADRILEIISCGGHEALPPLPLVPYAMAMSTTMIYQALRENQRDFERAYKDLELCCQALEALHKRFPYVRNILKLAKQLLELLARSGTKQIAENVEPPREHSAAMVLATMNGTPQPVEQPQQANEDQDVDGFVMPSISVASVPQIEQPAENENNTEFQAQLSEAYPNIDASYTQLDSQFHNLFDYDMPNFFRTPATWEYINTGAAGGKGTGEDSSAGGGSEFQFSYLSSPEIDFDYQQMQAPPPPY